VRLGKSELSVSDLCLGTMTWGEQTDEKDAHEQISMSISAGINFIDTAEMYPVCPLRAETTGDTERILGNWLGKNKSKRSDLIVATKISGKGYKNVRNGKGIYPKEVRIAVDASLKKLKTDYIDLYQLHWPNRGSYHFRQYWKYDATGQKTENEEENISEVVSELFKLKQEGKLRYIGLSNETAWGTIKFSNEAKKYEDFPIASIQNEYSLLCRLFDTDLAETCYHENIKLLAYSPLVGGMITGKYLNDQIPENSRLSRIPDMFGRVTDNSTKAIKAYLELSKTLSINPVHLALAFCRSRPFMGSVIFGATNKEQLKLILEGKDIFLDQEAIDAINVLFKQIPMPM
jgi:aryl-alcohol dehydrogenase-like predicted oxidoreductase